MEPRAIIERFDVVENSVAGFGARRKAATANGLILQTAPKGPDMRGAMTGSVRYLLIRGY